MSQTVSVLLPSRLRPDSLSRSVDSLRNLADSPDNIEVLVAFDADDPVTGERACSIGAVAVRFVERYGYSKLHIYYNELANRARGDWLFLWNDDALMKTENWDVFFSLFDPQSLAVLSPSSTGVGHGMCCFPAMSCALYDLLEHMSHSCHVDTWLQDLGNATRILHQIPVHIFHDRFDFTGSHNDQTYAEQSYQTEEFYSLPMQYLLQQDIDKVRACLA